jgi:DNA-binding PadR family transcriptional regulator
VAELQSRSGKVTRLLRLLRGHGIIAKVLKTHRYQLTEKGRTALAALLAARKANTKQLLQAA